MGHMREATQQRSHRTNRYATDVLTAQEDIKAQMYMNTIYNTCTPDYKSNCENVGVGG